MSTRAHLPPPVVEQVAGRHTRRLPGRPLRMTSRGTSSHLAFRVTKTYDVPAGGYHSSMTIRIWWVVAAVITVALVVALVVYGGDGSGGGSGGY